MLTLSTLVVTLMGGAWWAQSRKKKLSARTVADRQSVYDTAINSLKDSEKFLSLAKAFRENGMTVEAEMLEKRAALISAPQDVKNSRRESYRKGMASNDIKGVRALAEAFYTMGATGAAANLRSHANELESNEPAGAFPQAAE